MYICVLDFEATCFEDQNGKLHEIIEFPSVLLEYDEETGTTKVLSEFQEYCKPKIDPTLSDFCTKLTGITQTQVDSGANFPYVFKRHYLWLQSQIPDIYNTTVHILTYGAWDLNIAFPAECERWNIKSIPSLYKHFINIKKEASEFYKVKSLGMDGLLNWLKMDLLGRHHSGIDDCRNIARIFQRMLSDGYRTLGLTYV